MRRLEVSPEKTRSLTHLDRLDQALTSGRRRPYSGSLSMSALRDSQGIRRRPHDLLATIRCAKNSARSASSEGPYKSAAAPNGGMNRRQSVPSSPVCPSFPAPDGSASSRRLRGHDAACQRDHPLYICRPSERGGATRRSPASPRRDASAVPARDGLRTGAEKGWGGNRSDGPPERTAMVRHSAWIQLVA